jgi:polyisoprenoid-binding protein YceI
LKNGKAVIEKSVLKVDLRKLTSDQSRRDQYIRENNLESNNFPFAEFDVTNVDGFPADAVEGKELRFKVTGNMNIHGTSKPLTFDVRDAGWGHPHRNGHDISLDEGFWV